MHILNILLIFSFCCATLADDSCIFEHPTKGVINLTSIGLRNGQARFRNLSTILNPYYSYSFNPCYSFIENGCKDVAVCQISSNRLHSFTLAKQNISNWTNVNNTPVLTYTYDSKTVAISMICSSNNQDELEVVGENPVNYYSMHLKSRCACWNGCKTPPQSSTTTTSTPMTTHVIYYSACRYSDSRYGTIDLSSIGSMTGSPTFKDISTKIPDKYVWSYNPCYKFSESSCQNVSGCQIDKTSGISHAIGFQNNVSWINMNNINNSIHSIVYPSKSINEHLTVQLICDLSLSTHRLDVLGETSLNEYKMQLTSPCACWDGCNQPSPDPNPFTWKFWVITGSISIGVFLLCCMMITCLFCSKPRRPVRPIFIDETTPFIKDTINDCHHHT